MKGLKLLFIAILLYSINVSATEIDPVKPSSELRAELVKMIDVECDYLQLQRNDCTAEILFTINDHNEIVVISIESPNPQAESHFASKLNYKKVKSNGYKHGVFYLMPIRITRGL